MKKKLLTLIAVLTLCVTTVFGLTACGDNPKAPVLFGKEVVKLKSQSDILKEFDKNACNLGVMDSVMAGYFAGSQPDKYTQLDYVLSEENYVVAAKKGNVQLINKLNEALVALKNTKVNEIATEYNLQADICIPNEAPQKTVAATDKSFDNVKNRKTLTIGFTYYAPIAFKENNVFKGFDVQVPNAVVDYWNQELGLTGDNKIKIDFVEIEWSNKESMLANNSIDLAWNGLSWTQEREDNMELSVPYMKNKQVILCKTEDKAKYNTMAAFLENSQKAVVAVESGSNADGLMFLAD